MAGVISFSITGESGSMVAATTAAQLATSRLRVSVDEINAAFARANGAGSAAITAADLKSKGRAIGQSMSGIAMTASMLGGGEAAAIVYPVMLIGKELKGLSAAMKLAGISMGAAASSALIASAAVAAVAIAFSKFKEMRAAEAEEKKTGADLTATLAERSKAAFARLKMAADNGLITQAEASGWQQNYNSLFTGDSGRQNLLNAVNARLNAIGMAPRTQDYWNNQESFLRMRRMVEAQAQGDLQAQIEQVYQDAGDKLKAAFKTATDAGMDFGPLRDAILAWRDRKVGELNTSEKIAEAKGANGKFSFGGRLSSLEGIGLVLTSGVRDTAADPARSTAEHTRQLLNEVRITNTLLANGGNSYTRK